jgi:hypothetical protein
LPIRALRRQSNLWPFVLSIPRFGITAPEDRELERSNECVGHQKIKRSENK